MELFLFFNLSAQLPVDLHPLTVLVFPQAVFKHPGKLRKQPEGRHTHGWVSQSAAVIALQKPRGIRIALLGGRRQQSNTVFYILISIFSEQQRFAELILRLTVFLICRGGEQALCFKQILFRMLPSEAKLAEKICL